MKNFCPLKAISLAKLMARDCEPAWGGGSRVRLLASCAPVKLTEGIVLALAFTVELGFCDPVPRVLCLP